MTIYMKAVLVCETCHSAESAVDVFLTRDGSLLGSSLGRAENRDQGLVTNWTFDMKEGQSFADGRHTCGVCYAKKAAEVPTAADSDWCYATDGFGENWTECDHASTREEAVIEAVAHAMARGFTTAHTGWKRQCTHAEFVRGLGEEIRERLRDRACDTVGDHAGEYPDMKAAPFDEALEAFVLDYLQKHVVGPLFFEVDGIHETPVPARRLP